MTGQDTNALRKACLAARDRLSPAEVSAASETVAARLWHLGPLQRSQKIGIYFAVRGEIDCDLIATAAWLRRRQVFLPVICGRELRFARYENTTKFSRNRFGIPEPEHKKCELLHPRELDVAVVPTVAFDASGNRIGMGAGYYDRSFRILKTRKQWCRPFFIGVAHDFQKTPPIKAFSWDVPLQYAVTERKTYVF